MKPKKDLNTQQEPDTISKEGAIAMTNLINNRYDQGIQQERQRILDIIESMDVVFKTSELIKRIKE